MGRAQLEVWKVVPIDVSIWLAMSGFVWDAWANALSIK